jgi:hypothetical protein
MLFPLFHHLLQRIGKMFLALLLVCNNLSGVDQICVAIKAPKLTKTYAECVKMLDEGVEEVARQRLIVKDLMCVEFSQGV